MLGGLYGLSNLQKSVLYFSLLVPSIITLVIGDIVESLLATQIFYIVITYFYINFLSIEKSMLPYKLNQFKKINYQIHKGLVLGFSAFLLITFYGILFLKIGRVALPKEVDLGVRFHQQWYYFVLLCATGPFLEEWFWRLFIPKTFQQTYYQSHVINIAYLMFHFILFSRYVGVFRAIPLVGTFFSVGRSMSHIKQKYGIVSSVISHYGITLGGFSLFIYIKCSTTMVI